MSQTRQLRLALMAMTLYWALLLISCGGTSTSSSSTGPGSNSSNPGSVATPGTPPPSPTAQQASVVIVMEENHGFEDVIGNSAMPYFNSLAQQGALATQYYADAHPSIPNYLELTTGAMGTFDDNFSGTISSDNLAREIVAAGKSWKTYQEEIPSAGYLGDDSGNYIKHHNPFAYLSDVISDPSQTARIVPFTQFTADLNANALPAFSFVVPSRIHDAHSCPTGVTCTDTDLLSQADQWLKTNIAPLLSNSKFQNGGLLLIVFDEASLIDIRHGGGHVALIATGPKAKAGVQSTTFYQHENTLKTVCVALSLPTCPGSGASANLESDMVQP